MAPNITEITSTFQYDGIVSALPANQLLVIDFHAVWCGPCHAIAPVLEQLSNKFTHVKFVKIDVDKQAQLAQRFKVRAMPTFKFIKGGKEVDELKGASPPQLNALVAKHAGPASAFQNSGSGQKLGSGSASTISASGSSSASDSSSLLSQITAKGLSCLNESASHPLSSIVGPAHGPKGTSYLESDVDPELLISIPFNDAVKLKAISIFSGVSPSQAPKNIKLFINYTSMDFADAERESPAQEIELSKEDVKGNKVELRFVRFQSVRSLHILIKDNQEDEETTRIDSIDLYGSVGQTSDKGPLPKHDHEH
ncbi:PITH domain-containing protein [Dioszegia hungarica]|uniref:Thioredoxin n=1 Tax=Dioszegia hungarica TaxID=4972 RepID=A0AA38H8A8_9TREE|nr:PITH domain-containing protein [Dioszegia hungarica]KAI9635628.1 PITH domain-containing protein [Dioszegia hungarica]